MQPRTFCFIALFVGVFLSFAHATPDAVTEEAPTTEEQKVLLDCRHSDYRTYIKCLKRQKRHHITNDHNHLDAGSCLDDCMKKCHDEHNCDKQCVHCLRRTKHKHQIITEYENECSDSNDCSKSEKVGVPATNITTKIDINNYIGNGSQQCCPTCQPPVPCRPSFPSFPSQLTLVPQLTLGIGLGLGSGCLYPNQWPCIPQNYPNAPRTDCSGCGNPLLRYRCDVSCYQQPNVVHPDYSQGRNPNNPEQPCMTPHCVGGAK